MLVLAHEGRLSEAVPQGGAGGPQFVARKRRWGARDGAGGGLFRTLAVRTPGANKSAVPRGAASRSPGTRRRLISVCSRRSRGANGVPRKHPASLGAPL